MERRLAAILAADVVGYSRMMGEDEEGTLKGLKSLISDMIEPCVAAKRGRIFKLMGDGLLVEFPSAVDAVECALAWQDRAASSDGAPDDKRFLFRIGINLGDVMVEDDDIYGDGVNVASRLESIADPGGICVSDDVYRQVNRKLDVAFEDLGEQRVKNIAKPVRVYRTKGSDAQTGPLAGLRLEGSNRTSIAVLPFTNMSGDSEQDYFSDGLAEDIITGLSRFRSLFVIARNSSFTYKGKAVNVQQVGRELGAHYVLEGSVRRAGNRVRVTAQLIDAQSGSHLWAKKFDRELDDIFAVQDEITRSIVATLPERVGAADLKRVKRGSTDQTVAYDCFLRGRELHHASTKEANAEGIQLLEKAVESDPSFAQAWSWLACVLGQAFLRDYLPDKPKILERVMEALDRAHKLDEEDSECHRMWCEVYLIQRQFDEAQYQNDRALELNQNDPKIMVQRGYLLVYLGRPLEGIKWIDRALELDPLHPENYYANLGIALHCARQYRDAIKVFKRVPHLQEAHHAYLAACHAQLGETRQAEEHASKVLALNPDFTIKRLGRALRYKHESDAKRFLDDLREAGLPEG